MRFGDFLLDNNLVTPEELNRALERQHDYNRPMGKFAQKLGYINRKDNVRILLEQMKSKKRYGDLAVELGYLTRVQVDEVLEAKAMDSLMLGKILVQGGILTRGQFLHALKKFTDFNV